MFFLFVQAGGDGDFFQPLNTLDLAPDQRRDHALLMDSAHAERAGDQIDILCGRHAGRDQAFRGADSGVRAIDHGAAVELFGQQRQRCAIGLIHPFD